MIEFDIKPRTNRRSRLIAVKVDKNKRVIPKGDSRKPRWWRVTIGKKYTGTSKQRRFFDTEAESNEFIRDTEAARRQRGKEVFTISRALAVEALELAKQLKPLNATLTHAVKFYIKNAPIAGRRTVNELSAYADVR